MSEEPTPPRIEFFRGGVIRKRWYFRIRAGNGQIVAHSEGYSRKVDCIQTAAHLRGTLIEARLFDEAGGEIL